MLERSGEDGEKRYPSFTFFKVPKIPLHSVQFSHSVRYNFLQPHALQHTRLPCPSPTPGLCSNSCPSSWWCHPTISSFVVPFSSCLQSFSASGSFLMSLFFTSGGQSIGTSASASVLPMNIEGWFPLGLTGLISLQSKGLSRVFSNTTVQKHQFFDAQLSLWSNPYNIHDYWKNHSFDYIRPLHYAVILLVSVDCDSNSSGLKNVIFILSHS